MEINISYPKGEYAHMQLVGQLWEHEEFTLFKNNILSLLKKDIKKIVVDLGRLSFISSEGLGLIVTMFNDAKNAGAEIIIYKPKGCVREVLEISGFDSFMKIMYSKEQLQHV